MSRTTFSSLNPFAFAPVCTLQCPGSKTTVLDLDGDILEIILSFGILELFSGFLVVSSGITAVVSSAVPLSVSFAYAVYVF